LLNERENEKAELEAKILRNINKLVQPYIDELKRYGLDPPRAACLDVIEENLKHIISPFLEKLGLRSVDLTPRELRIADLIKSGKITKEISELPRMSCTAANYHKNDIWRKLGMAARPLIAANRDTDPDLELPYDDYALTTRFYLVES